MWPSSLAFHKKKKNRNKSKRRKQRLRNARRSAAAGVQIFEDDISLSGYGIAFSSDSDGLPNDVDEDYVCNVLGQQLQQPPEDDNSNSNQNGVQPSTASELPEAANLDANPIRGLDGTADDDMRSFCVDCRAGRTGNPSTQHNPLSSASRSDFSALVMSQLGRVCMEAPSDHQPLGQLKQRQEDDTGSSDSEAYSSPVVSRAEATHRTGAHFSHQEEDGGDQGGCGIPGIIPWWDEADDAGEPPETESDAHFRSILTGSFGHLSRRSRTELISQLLLPKQSPNGDRKQSFGGSRDQCCHLESAPSRRKRKELRQAKLKRKREIRQQKRLQLQEQQAMASSGPISAAPVPDDNVGSMLLKKLGWSPGTGLGAARDGILAPISVSRRAGRTGLGYDHSATGRYGVPYVDVAAASTAGTFHSDNPSEGMDMAANAPGNGDDALT